MYYACGIKNVTFHAYVISRYKWSCGKGAACKCEQNLEYTNNPENIWISFCTLSLDLCQILDSSRRQIRPLFPILLFWSKFKNTCKYVKLALKYQIIKRGGFFSTLFMLSLLGSILSLYTSPNRDLAFWFV